MNQVDARPYSSLPLSSPWDRVLYSAPQVGHCCSVALGFVFPTETHKGRGFKSTRQPQVSVEHGTFISYQEHKLFSSDVYEGTPVQSSLSHVVILRPRHSVPLTLTHVTIYEDSAAVSAWDSTIDDSDTRLTLISLVGQGHLFHHHGCRLSAHLFYLHRYLRKTGDVAGVFLSLPGIHSSSRVGS